LARGSVCGYYHGIYSLLLVVIGAWADGKERGMGTSLFFLLSSLPLGLRQADVGLWAV
jgi:hypothetical protein